MKKIKRIAILGCPGSGKTRLAVKLNEILDIPVYHLDKHFRTRDSETIDYVDVRRRMKEIVNQETWIADGNYNKTSKMRLDNADLVIYFLYPVETCLKRAEQRFNETKGKQRFDEPPGLIDYEFDPSFKRYIETYHGTYDHLYLAYLKTHKIPHIILHTDEEVNKFLDKVKKWK